MTDTFLDVLTTPPEVIVSFDDDEFDCACPVHINHEATPNVVLINGNSALYGAIAMPLINARPANVPEKEAFDLVVEMLDALIADVVQTHYAKLGDMVEGRDEEAVVELTFNPLAVELVIQQISTTSAYARMKADVESELLVASEMIKRELEAAGPVDLKAIGATLIDGVERNAEHPDSFEVPTAQEIAALAVGDIVKIGLEGGSDLCGGERFWCEVAAINNSDGQGEIELRVCNALVVYPEIAVGSTIAVEPRHVIAIQ